MDVNALLKDDYRKWKDLGYIYEKKKGAFEGKTFGRFIEDTYKMAHFMISRGLKDEKMIIFGKNSYELMVTDLAATAFAGISVVIAKDTKAGSLLRLIRSIDAKAVFYAPEKQEEVEAVQAETGISCFCFADYDAIPPAEELFALPSRDPEVCSKIVFSSGTTGPSKGVKLSLRNIFFGYEELSKRVQYDTTDRCYLFLPLNHVYGSCYCYYLSLIDGYRIYLASSTRNIAQELLETEPTFFCAVPLVYQKLLDQYGTDIKKAFGPRIRYLFCSGAPCPRELRAAYKELTMLQAFGMSETAASFAIDYPGDQDEETAGTIFSNIDAKIADPDWDGIGEIIVKGDNVFLGYLDEELTKQVFDGDGYFHTGDLGAIRGGKLILHRRKNKVLLGSNGENIDASALAELLTSLDDNISKVVLSMSRDKLTAEIYVKDIRKDTKKTIEEYNRQVLHHEQIHGAEILPDDLEKRLK